MKEIPTKRKEATKFLKEKVRGQKVFIKFDSIKYDKENNLLCYFYLRNKTFINAHIIKNGLADVVITFNYKYKQKFLDQKMLDIQLMNYIGYVKGAKENLYKKLSEIHFGPKFSQLPKYFI